MRLNQIYKRSLWIGCPILLGFHFLAAQHQATEELVIREVDAGFNVSWFNPREGGKLRKSSVKKVRGGSAVSLGNPPSETEEDGLVIVQKQ